MKQTKDPLQAFVLSRDAVRLANKAFFDPSMMGLLYFVSSRSACPIQTEPKAEVYSLTSINSPYIPLCLRLSQYLSWSDC